MEKRHRVLIAEDQHLLRSGLCRMVCELDDYCIVGEASGGIEAHRLARETLPDLILMDLTMPGGSGFEAITAIKRECPRIRIIVLTVHWSEDHVREAFAAGADGYVVKDASFDQLVREMRFVMQGHSTAGAGRISGGTHGSQEDIAYRAQLWNALTGRERTVLRLVVEGRTNRQVGECLSLSPKTIEKHRANLMRKLGIRNLNGLVRLAIDMGVLTLPGDERV
ncbi:LuxR family two component transcriptional regulator [Paraburkholderia silvatlantica]|uniref:LuxR family two component transcriptional regulator n=1 Tax=Paraburkholderia silvatlantica TaxID=321895 RepID=A0A2U0ZMR8_9BURK|nr:LuxR family two component transcriptional regulator [Paraburkholderia silvatlantica]PXW24674.1 LuxR family two component transcriptional regulator [Paraburkholderia silvatlantica]PYE18345.1 LuxR family two component transcriptional regulator [Paraburkholderia silvatlantica]TDQ97881.1 LuxR family two component transcriptional regulator [Paraburkholderia silvatlantica]